MGKRCKYELFLEKYYNFKKKDLDENDFIKTDFDDLCNLLAMFDQERGEAKRPHEASGLHLHDVIARYSIDEDAEYNIAKMHEFKIRLSDENEDGLTREEYGEYE